MTDAEVDILLAKVAGEHPAIPMLVGVIRQQRAEAAALRAENAELRAQVESLTESVRELGERCDQLAHVLEEARREAKRQAAPFRIADKKRAKEPKKPGRGKGHPGSWRPTPDHVDQFVTVPLARCPDCQGPLEQVRAKVQYIEETPLVLIRPQVTELTTYEGYCAKCDKLVQSTHPLQVSTAVGAAGTHLGPNATALAASLIYQYGLTRRKAARLLQDLLGLRISPGGLVHLSHRVASKLQPQHNELLQQVKDAKVIHADETSWWVGGPGHWLWCFTSPELTLYAVRDSRARPVIHEILGTEFPGVLCSDSLSVYDDASPVQQKCYAHHLKAAAETAERAPPAAEFCADVQEFLACAMMLKKLKPRSTADEFARERERLVVSAERLFGPTRANHDEEKLANRFRKQMDHLFTFLDYDEVDATNNLAERHLRPAVIARKISCGNRTPAGAATWETLTSLAATCGQTARSFLDLVADAARLQPATLTAR
jgi:transposase/cell division protein FtsB